MLFVLLLCLLVVIGIELIKILMSDSFAYNFAKRQKQFASMAIRENYFEQIENIKQNSSLSQEKMPSEVRIVDAEEFFKFVNKNIINIIRNSENVEVLKEKFNMSKLSKIFLVASFVLGAVVTIMTFIWGLF